MEESTFAVKHTALTEKKIQTPIDSTSEEGSDSTSSSGNTSSSSPGNELGGRKQLRKRKRRKRRSLKEIHEIGPVGKKLKLEKPKVVVPPGFLQPLSEIVRLLPGENISSSSKQFLNSGEYGNNKTAKSSFLKVTRRQGEPKKKTASSEKSNESSHYTQNMSRHDNPSGRRNSSSIKSLSSSIVSHMLDSASSVRSISSLQLKELDIAVHGGDGHGFSVGATKLKDSEDLGLWERSVEAAAAAAFDTNSALQKDKLDLLEKKLLETKKHGDVLASKLLEEKCKAEEEEHKLRKRLLEATDTIDALCKKLMWYRRSSCISLASDVGLG